MAGHGQSIVYGVVIGVVLQLCMTSIYGDTTIAPVRNTDQGIQAGENGCAPDKECVPSAVCQKGICKTRIGESCKDASDTNCESGSVCVSGPDSNFKCRIPAGESGCAPNKECVPTADCQNGVCKTRTGESCKNASDTNCESGSVCVSGPDSNFKCLRDYGSLCVREKSDQCQSLLRQVCTSLTNGENLCLCADDSFRDTNECKSKDELKATNVQASGQSPQETSITVTWTPSSTPGAQYKAALSEVAGQASGFAEKDAFTFTGLIPGKVYSVVVTSRKRRNPDYASDTSYTAMDSDRVDVLTKPAQPGELLEQTLRGPSVTLTFTPSEGHVDEYEVEAVSKQGGEPVSPTEDVDVQGTVASVELSNLTVRASYDVTILAISNRVNSEPRTATIQVLGPLAGKVTSLAVKEQGSRSVRLAWTKPAQPNGPIQGYTVKLEQLTTADNVSCFSGVTIRCSDCTYGSSEVTPDISGSCRHSAVTTMTQADMDDGQSEVSVSVDHLDPGTVYCVVVAAYNEEGEGSPNGEMTVHTVCEDPQDPKQAFMVVWDFPDVCESNGFSLNFNQHGFHYNEQFQRLAEQLYDMLYHTGSWHPHSAGGESIDRELSQLVSPDTWLALISEHGSVGAYNIIMFRLNLWREGDPLHRAPAIESNEAMGSSDGSHLTGIGKLVMDMVEALKNQNQQSFNHVHLFDHHEGHQFFWNEDYLENTLAHLADLGVPGVILSSVAPDTSHSYSSSLGAQEYCHQLHEHVHHAFGPFVRDLTQFMSDCSNSVCGGHGRCVYSHHDPFMGEGKNGCVFWNHRFHGYQCQCYDSWEGSCCETRIPSPCQKQLQHLQEQQQQQQQQQSQDTNG